LSSHCCWKNSFWATGAKPSGMWNDQKMSQWSFKCDWQIRWLKGVETHHSGLFGVAMGKKTTWGIWLPQYIFPAGPNWNGARGNKIFECALIEETSYQTGAWHLVKLCCSHLHKTRKWHGVKSPIEEGLLEWSICHQHPPVAPLHFKVMPTCELGAIMIFSNAAEGSGPFELSVNHFRLMYST
jgi:hypothetical protein